MAQKINAEDALSTQPAAGRLPRINMRLVRALSVGGGLLVVGTLWVGFRMGQQSADSQEESPAVQTSSPPDALRMLPGSYDEIVTPHPIAQDSPTGGIDPSQLARLQAKLAEEEELARASKLLFDVEGTGPTAARADSSAGDTLSPHSAQGYAAIGGDSLPYSLSERLNFSARHGDIEPYLNRPYRQPASPYEVKAGTLIPAVLVTAINTDLPGDAVARVTRNVYDSRTFTHLLIPRGATLYGTYNALVSNGQNRAQVIWQRLIMPNGRSIELDGMPAVDDEGKTGVKDKVDHHFDRIIFGTFVSALTALTGNLARGDDSTFGLGDAVGDTVAQEASRVGQRIVEREMSVQPTITIRAGKTLRVLVNRDIVLEPYTDNPQPSEFDQVEQ